MHIHLPKHMSDGNYNKNANIKFAHVTAIIETTSFPALLSAVSVGETVAAAVVLWSTSVEAGFVAST